MRNFHTPDDIWLLVIKSVPSPGAHRSFIKVANGVRAAPFNLVGYLKHPIILPPKRVLVSRVGKSSFTKGAGVILRVIE